MPNPFRSFLAVAGLLALAACRQPAPLVPAEEYYQCREVYHPHRGRIYDRHDSLLVLNQTRYTLSLAKGAVFDSVAFNHLLGWPAGALEARVASARLPAPPPPRPKEPEVD